MTQAWEYIKIALMNIKSNKGRSALTMLGIIIGIASVILIITTGNGIKYSVNDELSSIVGKEIAINSYGGRNEDGNYVEFTREDLEDIKANVDHVEYAYGGKTVSDKIENRKGLFTALIFFEGMDELQVKSQPIYRGREFTETEYSQNSEVCIIEEKSARRLFGTTDVVGVTLDLVIYNTPVSLEIVGVRKAQETAFAMFELYENNSRVELEVPDTIYDALTGEEMTYRYIYLRYDAEGEGDVVAAEALARLEAKYNCRGKQILEVENFLGEMDEAIKIMDYVTIFVVLVASISLLVGGIGVMNIMLVSVTERTREIGIRKSLGARTSSILLQFLSESAIITLLGGIIGIALGIGGAYLVCAIVGFTAKVSIASVLGASAFSAGVGLFFGIYPARKAAMMSPIEALRHE